MSKNINDYPWPNGDAYEVANWMNDCEKFGQSADGPKDERH